MKVYIEKMNQALNNKVDLLKATLKRQLYLLDHQSDSREHEIFFEIDSYRKKLIDEDVQFLKYYEKIFEVMGIKEIEDLSIEERAQFKPIQDKVAVILELEEHYKIQANMLSERERTLKNKIKNQNKIKAYKK